MASIADVVGEHAGGGCVQEAGVVSLQSNWLYHKSGKVHSAYPSGNIHSPQMCGRDTRHHHAVLIFKCLCNQHDLQ